MQSLFIIYHSNMGQKTIYFFYLKMLENIQENSVFFIFLDTQGV